MTEVHRGRGRPRKYPPGGPAAMSDQGLSDRQREIVLQAIQVMSEKGYHGTTIQDVADKLSFTKAAFYYYVRDKEELLYHIYRETMRVSLEMIETIAQSSVDPVTKLRNMIFTWTKLVADLNIQFRVYFMEKNELSQEHLNEITTRERALVRLLEQVYAQGVEEGLFVAHNTKAVAFGIVGMTSWVHHWFRPGGEMSIDEVANVFYEMTVKGLLVAPTVNRASPT